MIGACEPDLRRWIADTRALLARIEAALAPANDTSAETLGEWVVRWRSDRALRGLGDDRGRYDEHMAAHFGQLAVTSIQREHVEAWVEQMERRVLAGELRGTTAWRVWTSLRAMLRDSYMARSRDLRVRMDNPLRDVRQPDRGDSRVGPWLYPSEFMRLVSCEQVWALLDSPGGRVLGEGTARTAGDAWYDGTRMAKQKPENDVTHRPVGRPPTRGTRSTKAIVVRVTPAEHERYTAASLADGKDLAAVIRMLLDQWATRR